MNPFPVSAPIIPWIGGKRRLVQHLLPLFPAHRCYVEPFAGGGALFFAKEATGAEVLNDINGDLVNLYRIVQLHFEEFVKQFKWMLVSRESWARLNGTPANTLTDIQRAVRFYYVHKLGFGAKVAGRTFGTVTKGPPRLNLLRIEEDLSAAHLRLTSAVIENLEWSACVDRYDREHTFCFMDPPYWETEGYGVPFGLEQYTLLADKMRSMKGKSLLTVNDVEPMRKVFKGFQTKRVSITYSVGRDQKARVPRGELIVMNWPP